MSGEVTACGGCGSDELAPLLDMGTQPLSEGGSDRSYPLKLIRCGNCSLVQLSYIVDPAKVFRPAHPYSTGNSAMLRKHYAELAQELLRDTLTTHYAVDIGANDGTFANYMSGRVRVIAVEPTDQILKAYDKVLKVQKPWTGELARELHATYGPAKVIIACNVLAHVPDVHDFLDGVTELMGPDSVFITENHDLHSVTDGLQIDTIYHEHLRYYSVASLTRLLEAHGLHVASSQQVPTHGGSFRVTAHKVKANFPARAKGAATALRGMLHKIVNVEHKTVYGIGASTRATPLIHYAGIASEITVICEVAGSDKIGTRLPGTQIPVVDEQALIDDQPEYALVLNWHIAGYVLPKLRERGYRGQFVVPLPVPKIISAADAYKEKPYG